MQRLMSHITIAACIALSFSLMLTGCGPAGDETPPSGDTVTMETSGQLDASESEAVTREVVQRHLRTFGEGDLEGILADYADDAVMFTPDGPIKGMEELRAAFEQFISEWGQPGTTFELTQEEYDGAHGYVSWTAETAANVYEYGVDGFTVRDGKIVAQFFGAHTTPKTP